MPCSLCHILHISNYNICGCEWTPHDPISFFLNAMYLISVITLYMVLSIYCIGSLVIKFKFNPYDVHPSKTVQLMYHLVSKLVYKIMF